MSFQRRPIRGAHRPAYAKVSQILGGLAPSEPTSFTLDGTGGQLLLTGGTATFGLSLGATGSQLTLTGGEATLSYTQNVYLDATGGALVLTGGTATFALSLSATGGALLALSGGTAALGLALTGQSAALTLSGGQAGFGLSMAGSGGALTLTGGTAGFSLGGNLALVGTGGALVLTGGEATFSLTDVVLEPEQPTGGWAAANWAALERARRRRLRDEEREAEDEALADRLERQLAAEGLVPVNEPAEARILVREYRADAANLELLNRRAQRAVAYAERARTELAYLLAARAIARQLEEEELALLLILAAA